MLANIKNKKPRMFPFPRGQERRQIRRTRALILEILTTCHAGSTAKSNECNLLATGLLCNGLVHDNHSAEKTMVLVQSPLRREVFSNEYVWVAVFVRTLYGKQSGL